MGKTPTGDTNLVPAARSESASFLLITSIADTTWRMFVPTLPMITLGNWLDSKWSTRPWMMLVGALIGGLIAAWLVRAQLRGKK